MSFEIIGGNYSNNGKDGVHISGQSGGRIEGVIASNNRGNGIGIGAAKPTTIDDETRKLVEALVEALEQKDKSEIKKVFGYIADKSVDLAVAVVAGKIIGPGN
ncbi:MAG TPA: hypothetical protein VK694_05870 [Verrucomicrobiae bacterium]|nr:hypothetical protein [Verrucomicrobiae bacterium]